MSETTGTFLVTETDPESAVLRNVETGQIHALAEQFDPAFESGEVLSATIRSVPPMEVTWELVEVEGRRTIEVIDSDLSPTRQAETLAEGEPPGEVIREEREGPGEIHVVTVPEGEAEQAARDVLEDEQTVARAARLGAVRVEVRTGEG
ncbi:MAG: DUF5812 family protein, partial [Halanaeroarchaeum sp.]